MASQVRARRSLLFMPGSNTRAIAKSRSLGTDACIIDLEDAVSPEAKAAARHNAVAALREGGFGHRERLVRINGLKTPWGRDDIAALASVADALDGVVVPKVESAATLLAVRALLTEHGAPHCPLWALAETARGIVAIEALTQVAAAALLVGIMMGTADLGWQLGVAASVERLGLLHALSRCVLAARAAELEIVDGVYGVLKDPVGLRRQCEQGKALGFTGKTLIHPEQVAAANEVFGPSAAEIAHARAVVATWENDRPADQGVVVVAGQMVEELHVKAARRLLELVAILNSRGALL